MPITGKLEADFGSFYDAVQKAEVSLKSFESGAGKVETSLNRMTDSFSGRKIIQDATLMAEAVDRIGGVSRLTEGELARIGSTASEAAEKMRALGVDVPPQIENLATATQHANKGFLEGIPLVQGFVAAFTIEKIIEFGKELVSFAGHFQQIAEATGLSSKAVQQFALIGGDFGFTADEMARAIFNFTNRLSGGDKNAIGAMADLGLNVKSLIAAGPEEAFLQWADAAGRLEDPMAKINAAADVLGSRNGPRMAGMLRELRQRFDDAGNSAAMMSEETTKSADRFDAAWRRAWTTFKAVTADLVTGATQGLAIGLGFVSVEAVKAAREAEEAASAAKKLAEAMGPAATKAEFLQNWLNSLMQSTAALSDTQKTQILLADEWGASISEIAKHLGVTEKAVSTYLDQIKAAQEAQKKFFEAMDEMNSVGEGWLGTLKTIDGETSEAIRFYLAAGVAQDKLATAYGLSAAQIKSVASALKAEQDALAITNKSILETTKLWDELYALQIAHGGTATDALIAQVDRWAADEVAKLSDLDENWLEHYNAIQAVAHEKLSGIMVDWNLLGANSRQHLQDIADKARATFDAALADSGKYTAGFIAQLREQADAAQRAADAFGTAYDTNFKKVEASIDRVTVKFTDLVFKIEKGATMDQRFNSIEGRLDSFLATLGQNPTARPSGLFGGLPTRDVGGPVTAGQSYLIGGRPELFTPGASGFVTPMGGGGATNITINVTHPLGTPEQIAKVVGDAFMQRRRNIGDRNPTGA